MDLLLIWDHLAQMGWEGACCAQVMGYPQLRHQGFEFGTAELAFAVFEAQLAFS